MLVSTNETLRIEISENDGEVLCSKISFRYLYLILGNPELISKKTGNSLFVRKYIICIYIDIPTSGNI